MFAMLAIFAGLLLPLLAVASSMSTHGRTGQKAFGVANNVDRANARYIFTNFLNSDEHIMYVYTSDNATDWDLLAGPAFIPPGGSTIRDPSIIYHTDGLYYICYTTSWFATDFAIASSSDLVNWSLYATIPTNTTFTPHNTWAPEWFIDPVDKSVNIIVSLSTEDWGPFTPSIYTATDSSLTKFSGPVAMEGVPTDGLGYIDTFAYYLDGVYHIFAKSETSTKFIEHAIADKLAGPYTFVQTGDFAGWGQAEGAAITTLPDGTFRIWMDGFTRGSYLYADSPDLYNWTGPKILGNGLSGFIRHGTVLRQW